MPITLVNAGTSPFGIKCKLVLLEKAIPYTLQPAGPWNVEGHPRRELPLLIDGDLNVWDSRIICEYLEDKYPTPTLMPRDPVLRVRSRTAAEVVDTHLEAINWGMGEVLGFQRAGPPESPLRKQLIEAAHKQSANFFQFLSNLLSSDPSQPYFGGDCFSIGDCAVVANLIRSTGLGIVPEEGTKLAAWWAKVKERSSVKKVLEEDAYDMENRATLFPDVPKMIADGTFKRE
ncbi:hypothetical protein HDU93_005789, partial [Gonapodya sp. JEL0774]